MTDKKKSAGVPQRAGKYFQALLQQVNEVRSEFQRTPFSQTELVNDTKWPEQVRHLISIIGAHPWKTVNVVGALPLHQKHKLENLRFIFANQFPDRDFNFLSETYRSPEV